MPAKPDDASTSPLSGEDVAAIIKLIGDLAGRTDVLNARRRDLMLGLAGLVDADVWMWVRSRVGAEAGTVAAWEVLDGGYADEAERTRVLGTFLGEEVNRHLAPQFAEGTHLTRSTQQLFPAHDPKAARALRQWEQGSGFSAALISAYQLEKGSFSAFGFHRRVGRPLFGPRERTIVHLICGQIEWLHRAHSDVPGNDVRLLALTRREREVLLYLLGGDARKDIARKMQISPYTVADYSKSIYKHFGVASRAALVRLFMSGNAMSPPAE